MLGLGTIGTSWITAAFVSQAPKELEWKAVYSRTEEKAKAFAKETGGEPKIFTLIEEMLKDDQVDVVYIASPNALHAKQAKIAIEAGKNVVIEKPAVQSYKELEDLYQLADEHQVMLFEAARHLHEPNMKVIIDYIHQHQEELNGGSLHFAQYSSRYDKVLKGEMPNIFNPKFAGGALNDIGVYAVYAAVAFFGLPEKAIYLSQKIRTGVDGAGVAVLDYGSFEVMLHISKIFASQAVSEIYFGKKRLVLDKIQAVESAILMDTEGNKESLEGVKSYHFEKEPLNFESQAFLEIIEKKDVSSYAYYRQLALDTAKVMDELRKTAYNN